MRLFISRLNLCDALETLCMQYKSSHPRTFKKRYGNWVCYKYKPSAEFLIKLKKVKTTNIPFLDNDWSCISPGSGVGKWSLSNLGKNFKSISNAFKGTVDVIASDPPLVKGHVRLSTVPYKPLYC